MHTPGPWILTIDGRYAEVRASDGEVLTEHYIGHDNARLIAAAPAILEALEEAEDLLVTTLWWPEGWNCTEAELLGNIRKAIALAKGD